MGLETANQSGLFHHSFGYFCGFYWLVRGNFLNVICQVRFKWVVSRENVKLGCFIHETFVCKSCQRSILFALSEYETCTNTSTRSTSSRACWERTSSKTRRSSKLSKPWPTGMPLSSSNAIRHNFPASEDPKRWRNWLAWPRPTPW